VTPYWLKQPELCKIGFFSATIEPLGIAEPDLLRNCSVTGIRPVGRFTSFSLDCSDREGDIASLRVNAIVHPSNESFTENSGISHRVLEAAGPRLKDELLKKIKCE